MKRIALSLAVAALGVSLTGCGCCRGLFNRTPTAPAPVAMPAAPVCAPACECDPCSAGYAPGMVSPPTYGPAM